MILVASGMQVYAYSVAFGRQLGSWAAHDDTVACLQLLTGDQLVTASWDCSVKLWRRAVPMKPVPRAKVLHAKHEIEVGWTSIRQLQFRHAQLPQRVLRLFRTAVATYSLQAVTDAPHHAQAGGGAAAMEWGAGYAGGRAGRA